SDTTILIQYPLGSVQTSYTVPDGVTEISVCAFKDCPKIEEVILPDSVKTVGRFAFYGCSGITEINIPQNIEEIGGWAFCDCPGITEITIPQGVTGIGGYAFGCYYDDDDDDYVPYDNFTLFCYTGTKGEKYAKEFGIAYVLIDTPKGKAGLKADSVYSVDGGTVYGIAEGTSFDDFTTQFGSKINVKDAKGDEITSGDICTGHTVSFGDNVFSVAVQGDTDGNGKIDSTDYICIKRHILGINGLSGAYKKAADTDMNGKIDSTDYIMIKRQILGVSVICQPVVTDRKIKEDYAKYENEFSPFLADKAENVVIREKYGPYNGAYVMFINFYNAGFPCIITEEKVSTAIFVYSTAQKLTVYKNGRFMTLTEAFENGILSVGDIISLNDAYYKKHPSLKIYC
ncbi:MAG: leucine-rich repeat protein, partial [Clostridia bacterium]|nr:leucine-rich repeat protein [Clostridia bacterium]